MHRHITSNRCSTGFRSEEHQGQSLTSVQQEEPRGHCTRRNPGAPEPGGTQGPQHQEEPKGHGTPRRKPMPPPPRGHTHTHTHTHIIKLSFFRFYLHCLYLKSRPHLCSVTPTSSSDPILSTSSWLILHRSRV